MTVRREDMARETSTSYGTQPYFSRNSSSISSLFPFSFYHYTGKPQGYLGKGHNYSHTQYHKSKEGKYRAVDFPHAYTGGAD